MMLPSLILLTAVLAFEEPEVDPILEFEVAIEGFIDADEQKRRALFERLCNFLSYSYPDEYSSYNEKHSERVRNESFKKLIMVPDCMAFFERMVREPGLFAPGDAAVAAGIIADRGTIDALETLVAGYEAIDRKSSAHQTFARHLGRCAAKVAADPRSSTLLEKARELLRGDLSQKDPVVRGAGIDGLYRTGPAEEALAALEAALTDTSVDLADRARTIRTCRRLFGVDGFPKSILDRALELMRQGAREVLSGGGKSQGFNPLPGVSRSSRLFKAVAYFMRVHATVEDIPLLMECYQSENAAADLGVDALQNMRVTLQELREDLDDEDARFELDSMFFESLRSAGERLLRIADEPMSDAEKRQFATMRNFRYNAASYFVGQWKEFPDVREVFFEDETTGDFLTAFALAVEDVQSNSGEYTAVKEKLETRVLAARLVAKLVVLEEWETEVNLEEFFIKHMAEQLSTSFEDVYEAFLALKESRSSKLVVRIPEERPPFDIFVRNVSANGLAEFGEFDVFVTRSGLEIRVDPSGSE